MKVSKNVTWRLRRTFTCAYFKPSDNRHTLSALISCMSYPSHNHHSEYLHFNLRHDLIDNRPEQLTTASDNQGASMHMCTHASVLLVGTGIGALLIVSFMTAFDTRCVIKSISTLHLQRRSSSVPTDQRIVVAKQDFWGDHNQASPFHATVFATAVSCRWTAHTL